MKFISYILLSFLVANVFAQSDTSSIDRLYTHSKKFWYTNRDSSLRYLSEVKSLSDRLNYTRGKGYVTYGLGWHEKNIYHQFQFYTQSLEYFTQCHDLFGVGIVLNAIGLIYSQMGDEQKSMEYTLRSIEYKKRTNDWGGLGFSYINLGHFFLNKKDYEQALENYQHALFYRIKAKDPLGIGYAQINISQVLTYQEKWREAMVWAKRAKQQIKLSNDSSAHIWETYLIGHILFRTGKTDSAYLQLAPVAQITSNQQYNIMALAAKSDFIQLLKQRKDFVNAFHFQEKYLAAKDTLQKRDRLIETRKLANEYEFQLSQKEREEYEKKMATQILHRNNMEYLIIAVAVFILFAILFSGKNFFSEKMLSAFIFIGLLLLFEFILVMTDPWVEMLTGTEPFFKLIANLALALLILPVHHLLETLSKQKLLRLRKK
ncbi:MAG: tetratricopeptide repeat protein [Bacteroidetes bacterium]|nr:tetratricopeptide repeat protein [Bacteroidota bacterium]